MRVCWNCFYQVEGDPCPHCGYDTRSETGRNPFALRPGSTLNGRYVVGRVLGQGGFGITYIALDDWTKQRVAIKEYFPSEFAGRIAGERAVVTGSAERRETFEFGKNQFLEEARTLAQFQGNPHIVQVHNFFDENGTAYFSMEYLDGVSLKSVLEGRDSPMSMQEARQYLLPVIEALSLVHQKGLIHRDLSPDNILVLRDGNVKLIDFGAARYSTGEMSKSLDVVLKHGFAPMEQYARRGRQGPWTDVYAVGATFYYLLTGKVPPDAIDRYSEDTLIPPRQLGADLSETEEQVLLRALAVTPDQRIQSMQDLYAALTGELKDLTAVIPPAPAASAAKAAAKAPQKKRVGPLVAAAVLLAAVGIGAFFALGPMQKNRAYAEAAALLESGDYEQARETFLALGDFKDSAGQAVVAEKNLAYEAAEALFAEEQFNEAAEAFRALGSFKDSAEKAGSAEKEATYRLAMEKREAGETEEATALLESIRGYRDVDALLAGEESASQPEEEKEEPSSPYQIKGSVVTLGSYEQDNDANNGAEPIEWQVLEYDGESGTALLITRYLVDSVRFNENKDRSVPVSWADCDLRVWLNSDFFGTAFTAEEQASILLSDVSETLDMKIIDKHDKVQDSEEEDVVTVVQDHVFLLDNEEVKRYLPTDEDRACELTAYANKQTVYTDIRKEKFACFRWWLRDCRKYTKELDRSSYYWAGYINEYGDYFTSNYNNCFYQYGVRPVIRVDISKLPAS